MAAYAAVISLMYIINNIENHPSPPISLDKHQVESLIEKLTFLEEFLESYDSPFAYRGEADPLEIRVADATHAVEDVIESYIVDTIHLCAATGDDDGGGGEEISGIHFYQDLQKVIEEMDLIKKEAMQISITWEKGKQQRNIASDVASSRSRFTKKISRMVGFDDVYLELLDKLTNGNTTRQIIPIVGMGGIGKTTLAKGAFEHRLIKEHFDLRIWTTISHTYNVREILREFVFQATGGSSSDLSEDERELGEKVYAYLYGRRYLIIMDDMWSIEVWDKIRSFLPNNTNGSRIIVTTRLSSLGSELNGSYQIGMKFLDEVSSWDLFCDTVFEAESCPIELENIGKNIVANCKGLPFSIATIGGLLANSERTREYWEYVKQNLNSIVYNINDEFHLLRMSYIYLPNHLKPCFLYMGVFKEDSSIRVSMLKKLWVSEGFLKPTRGKCLETIAQEYLMELVQRNLIFVYELGSTGNVKYCKIHNMLRELCLKEVENERFYHVIRDYTPFNNSERRVVFPVKTRGLLTSEVLGSLSHARSIICDNGGSEEGGGEIRLPNNLRLLKTFKAYEDSTTPWNDAYFLDNVFGLVNSCYLAVNVHRKSKFPASIGLLWNLQTLIIYCRHDLNAPIEIWKLHQLRHLVFVVGGVILPDPPNDDNDIVIMENLQTLKGAKNLILKEEVVKRIPNVKKLHLSYDVKQMEGENCLANLQWLSKLENFSCSTKYGSNECWQWISFPHSLWKLVVDVTPYQEVEGILEKIGSLPLLEKFVLKRGSFKSGMWETSKGHFRSLKSLHLEKCLGLENWIMESSHFPCLEKLYLCFVGKLKEIPSEIGDIPTLRSIYLVYCTESAVLSAKRMAEEQEDLYGDDIPFHVQALVRKKQEALQGLENANFKVEVR